MSSEWRSVQLGDIAQFKAGSAFKLEFQGISSGELPFIKVSDLNLPGNEHAIRTANNWISRELAKEIKAAIHPLGATVFAKIGVALTYNRRRVLLQECAIDNNMMSAIPDESAVRPRYLYFLLKSLDFNEIAQGSALPYLNARDLKSIEVRLPNLGHQDAVVDILGSIEDRIDGLSETNATLEAIAQALFKSWFVDFDPVHAKAEGREPEGMDPATAALFPSEFEDSKLGPIPMGWEARPLDSIADYRNGLALQRYPPESEDKYLPVIKIAQLRAGHTERADRASAQLNPEYVVSDGDVLFSWSGSLEVALWLGGRGALNQHLFKVTSREAPKWLYYFATRHHLPMFREVAAHKATTMGHIQRRHLKEALIAVPPAAVLSGLSETMSPLMNSLVTSGLNARTVSALRDTLLPRLLAGELSIKGEAIGY